MNLFNKDFVYAIIGATTNPKKYGHTVLLDLHKAGYKVVGVNPHYKDIEGISCYPNLQDVEHINIAVFVIPPQKTEEVLKTVKELGIKTVWMQPGSESEAAIKFCEENNIECIHSACIMVKKLQV